MDSSPLLAARHAAAHDAWNGASATSVSASVVAASDVSAESATKEVENRRSLMSAPVVALELSTHATTSSDPTRRRSGSNWDMEIEEFACNGAAEEGEEG